MPNLFSPGDLWEGYLFDEVYKNLVFSSVNDVALIELEENLSILKASSKDYIFLQLQDDQSQPLCVLRLKTETINNQSYYSVDKSHAFIKGKGYAIPLYEYAFCYLELPVVSDKIQTMPGSSKLWKKFQKKQEAAQYEIYIFNTQTDNKGLFLTRNYNDYDVWGWPKEQIITLADAPDFIEDFTAFENFDDTTITAFPSYELEEEIQDTLQTNFIYESTMDPQLEKFLRLGQKRLKDREHILLLGKRK